ncbi:uncharacterized protein LOC117339018 [Pecten maximus]|uniref:uncharacterized protein LOC117339018 n=1 Tax=Pecten maximus TaxID=6579 RepID=UPI0014584C2C|nr:uncharacterized protein LOC117339018 [Pecten maximus]
MKSRITNTENLVSKVLLKMASGPEPMEIDYDLKHQKSRIQSRSHQVASSQPGVGKIPLFLTREGIEVYVYKHSITHLQTDAIVNAANDDLKHIGGVAKAISVSAGAFVDYECRSIILKRGKPISVTNNVHTKAGNLKNKYIIHAVGPQWRYYRNKEKCLDDLSWTVEFALDKAADLGCAHVGMPAISAGIFGVPKVLCAEMYIRGIVRYSKQSIKTKSKVKEIHFVDIDDEIIREMHLAHQKWHKNPKTIDPKESFGQFSCDLSGSSLSVPGTGNQNDASAAGIDNRSNGVGKSTFWVHDAPSKIRGLDDSVENFIGENGLFTLKIYTGSIVRVRDVDAILCSADRDLSGLGPLANALRTAGGKQYEKHFEGMRKQTNSGKETVCRCKPGDLSVGCVVHAVIDTDLYRQPSQFEDVQVSSALCICFVEKKQYDLEKVCEAMQVTLTDFCKEVTSRRLSEVHFVNKNPAVTKTILKYFKQNSVPAGSRHSNSSSASNDAYGRLKQNEKGARPKSSTPRLEFLAISEKEEQHRKHNSKHLSHITKRRSASPSKRFSETVHATSRKSDSSDTEWIMEGEKAKTKSTRLKQTPGNVNILDETDLSASSHQNGATNSQLKQTSEVSPSGHKKGAANNRLKQSDDQKRFEGEVCDLCDTSSAEMTRLQCGHSFCDTPCFLPMVNNMMCPVCSDVDNSVVQEAQKTDDMCVICMDAITDQKQLPCGHVFCSDCIMQSMAHKPACPVCGKIFGMLEGDQPKDGTMHVKTNKYSSLPGYESVGTIEIRYVFQNGTQKENHPRPGKPYQGTERRGFLPDNKEGQKVLGLLQKAFASRLTFTIGSSRTTGKEDVVTWNDIHHKTKREGGTAKFGYPDPTYLTRVQEELAAKGVKE